MKYNNFVYDTHASVLICLVMSSPSPNQTLSMLNVIDRNLFYLLVFIREVWSGGLDCYLNSMHGEDFMLAVNAAKFFNIEHLNSQFNALFKKVPEVASFDKDYMYKYEKLLIDRNLEKITDLYDFEIKDDVVNKQIMDGIRMVDPTHFVLYFTDYYKRMGVEN